MHPNSFQVVLEISATEEKKSSVEVFLQIFKIGFLEFAMYRFLREPQPLEICKTNLVVLLDRTKVVNSMNSTILAGSELAPQPFESISIKKAKILP